MSTCTAIDGQGIGNDGTVVGNWQDILASNHWDVFATLTFPHGCRREEQAFAAFRRWLWLWQAHTADLRGSTLLSTYPAGEPGRWANAVPGRWWRGKAVNWARRPSGRSRFFVMAERFACGNDLHLHGLICFPPKLGGWDLQLGRLLWEGRYPTYGLDLGRSRVETPRDQTDVIGYVTKTLDTAFGNYDFWLPSLGG